LFSAPQAPHRGRLPIKLVANRPPKAGREQ